MNRNERLLIFTEDDSLKDASEFVKALTDYHVVGIVSQNNIGGFDIKNNEIYEEQLNQSDIVLFTECEDDIRSNTFVKSNIFKAINAGKNVICAVTFNRETVEEMRKTASLKNVSFVYAAEPYMHRQKGLDTRIESSKMKEINTPVVFVAGVSERTQKFYIQLALRQNFKSRGYKVAQIGTKNYCDILGFHPIPSFMYSSELSELSKIILFNHYVKKIEITEEPDIIIIGIPGGILPIDTEYNNRFGITAFEISQAVCPDAVVLSTLYENLLQEYFHEMNLLTKYRFGFEIDCFNIANTKFDWAESQMVHKPCFLTVDTLFVNQKKAEYRIGDKPVFNILDHTDAEQLTDFIIERLSEYEMMGIVD